MVCEGVLLGACGRVMLQIPLLVRNKRVMLVVGKKRRNHAAGPGERMHAWRWCGRVWEGAGVQWSAVFS